MRRLINQITDHGATGYVFDPYRYRFALLGVLLPLGLASLAWAEQEQVTVEVGKELIDVRADGQTVLSYRRSPSPFKSYVQTMRTPGGIQVLRDKPEDHEHHHAMMFAVRVEDADFWVENASHFDPTGGGTAPTVGWQVPRPDGSARVTETPLGREVVINDQIDWLAGGKRPLLVEDRKITLHTIDKSLSCTLLTWQCRLETAPGVDSAKLWGTHYCGLGMRLVAELDGQGEIVVPDNASGDVVRGAEQLYTGSWCAYVAPFGDRQVTVVLLDHPENERAAKWFAMQSPFSYLAATIGLDQEPLVLEQGESVNLRYGVALADGRLNAKQIESLRQAWQKRIQD
jgi:hypothetical protein